MKLLIAIPALDEEESIEAIIERTLQARAKIIQSTVVDEVEITVVSDGSTDDTVRLAQAYTDRIGLVVFEVNRGYGAAIKYAWEHSDADLLAFLDADGTCDPNFFADLAIELVRHNADVVLGSRLNRSSSMPVLRRLGNTIFSLMLSTLSSNEVRDTASGMRIVRRTALPDLLPLPDGLDFTPAMSARAVLSDGLVIREIDMPYHERKGESKLNVRRDGLRFLRIILRTAFLNRPAKVLDICGGGLFLLAIALMLHPLENYLDERSVPEWMIYRFIVMSVLAIAGLLLLCAGYLATRMAGIALPSRPRYSLLQRLLGGIVQARLFWAVPSLLLLLGAVLVWPAAVDLLATGQTELHWSRFFIMSFLALVATQLAVTRLLDTFLRLVRDRADYLRSISTSEVLPEGVAADVG